MGQVGSSNKPVVLVVEDEPLLRIMAIDLVEDAGLEPREAAGSNETIHILETCSDVRVVFTDIDMPGGPNGLELAAIVRDRWPPVGIIITSGKPLPVDEDIPPGGVFFSKPYNSNRIIAMMRSMAFR